MCAHMAKGSDLLSHERYATFFAELHRRLVIANVEAQILSGRANSKHALAIWDYSEIGMEEPLWPVESPDKAEEAGEALPGAVSYETALSLCIRAVDTGKLEIVNGGFTRERRTRRKLRKSGEYDRQTVVCACVHNGRLYCGIAVTSATKGASLLRPFGASKTAPNKEAIAKSPRCFSVELF